jgi:predicted metal-dependent phosphoesterase TrpH
MRFADLHTHTYHSDGTRSPQEVVDLALRSGLQILAISDHDNLAAYFEIKPYADRQGMTLIPATELSCGYEGVDIHVLAYAFDPHDERFERRLQHFRATRQQRGYAMLEKLRGLGINLRTERVEELCGGGSMGRPHVARALVEAGCVESVGDAFKQYLGAGKPAYVEKERFRIEEAVELVHACGGLTSVAHPSVYPDHRRLLPELLDRGIDGIEVFHPEVPYEDQEHYRALARFRGKLVTGGSDDHGMAKAAETLGTIRVPENLIGAILDRI